MRRLLFTTLFAVLAISLISCGDSGTGPDPGSEPEEEESETPTYSVSVDVTPSDAGTVSPSLDSEYDEGKEIQLLASPEEDYVFAGWNGDMEGDVNPLPLTVSQDYEITANFERKEYELTTHIEGEGSVQENVLEQQSKEYEHGTAVELVATPAKGYKFVEWTGDLEGTDNPAEITVADPKEVTAVFEKKSYELAVTTEGSGAVSEQVVSKAKDYEYGDVVELMPSAAEGWEFVEWSGDLSGSDVPAQITVDTAKAVTAVFERKSFALDPNIQGEGSIAKDPDQDEYKYGDKVTLTANPADGWRFKEWAGEISGTTSEISITVNSERDITAVFDSTMSTLSLSTDGQGSVTKDPDKKEFAPDSSVTLTADSDEGWEFVEWTGDVYGTQPTTEFMMDSDKTVKAVFEKKSYDLTVNTEGEGSVSEERVQSKRYDHGTTVELTAEPADDWRFVEWQGDVTGSDNPAQVTVDNPKEVKAVFEPLFYLAKNGVTVVCPEADPGDKGILNGEDYGKEYEAVDRAMLDQMISNKEGLTAVCTTNITDMSKLFYSTSGYNPDISKWDVSNVTDMGQMFYGANDFNRNIASWDVSNVTNMSQMFRLDLKFNQDISKWDVSSVTDMSQMFASAESFNQNLNRWDVSSVTDMSFMFSRTNSFNGEINDWNVSNVTNMASMFQYSSFNQYINSWDVSSVTNMSKMFGYTDYSRDLSGWDVSSVTDMSSMFAQASNFNEDISGWDVSSVTKMTRMFYDATSFNQDISGWCVSNIGSEPNGFDTGAAFDGNSSIQPQWGTCP